MRTKKSGCLYICRNLNLYSWQNCFKTEIQDKHALCALTRWQYDFNVIPISLRKEVFNWHSNVNIIEIIIKFFVLKVNLLKKIETLSIYSWFLSTNKAIPFFKDINISWIQNFVYNRNYMTLSNLLILLLFCLYTNVSEIIKRIIHSKVECWVFNASQPFFPFWHGKNGDASH